MSTTVSTGRVARAVRRLPHPRVLSKFVVTGALVGCTNIGLVTLLVVLGMPIQIALALGFIVAITMHFTLNRQWVFAEDSGYALHFSRQGLRYLLIAGISYAGTAICGRGLSRAFSASPSWPSSSWRRSSWRGVSFLLLNFWVFQRAEPGRVSAPMVSVVVPCLNEEDNVRPLYERLGRRWRSAGVDYEIIFSLDPCTDATEERIRELRVLDPRVKMLRLSRRFGQPAATMAGLRMALGRRLRGHRLRPPGSAGADRAT